ncbi:hypothetical protein GE115_09810 [Agromyces sp. CFH 90414]|uniref:Multidrug transporter n=1 Tax=Agromyces agglutinans TaxID=2662258 RepID=A0A6I2F778_9MICO|nr:hypothetical protein [Agromyces agglutinans]MRG60161.1 hypothetical protein [Agromyces agglutinans]
MSDSDGRQATSSTGDRSEKVGEIENPEDLPSQVEVTEHDGVTRIDIADDATTRPGDPMAERGE